MRLRKYRIFIIIICIFLIIANVLSIVFDDNSFCYSSKTKMAKPIIEIKTDDMLEGEINEKVFPMEYNFEISNYKQDRINELECDYSIEFENSVSNFPIKYTLIDRETNKEIKLQDGKSEKLKIKKDRKQDRYFKLILEWKELNIEFANEVEIKLKINVEQEIVNEA